MPRRPKQAQKHAQPSRQEIPPDQITFIKDLWNEGHSNRSVSRKTRISRRCIDGLKLNITLFNEPYPKFAKKGKSRLLTHAQELRVIDYLRDRPTSYHSETVWFIYDEFDIAVSESTVSSIVKRHNFSKKKAQRKALEQSQELRENWRTLQRTMTMKRVCCVDESGSNERTGWRKTGYSKVNKPCRDLGSSKRSKRWSILPAITWQGYLEDYLIYQGSIKAVDFEDWLEIFVLPRLERGMFLAMDNASIHHTPRVQDLCNQFGIHLRYLPPYSPDYNPIEMSFNALKAWIRHNFKLAEAFETFGLFLQHALEQVDTVTHAAAWFWTSGYRY